MLTGLVVLLDRLLTVTTGHPEQDRRGRLLNVLLGGLLVAVLPIILINVAQLIAGRADAPIFIAIGVIIAAVLVGLGFLNHHGHTTTASYIFLGLLLIAPALAFKPDDLIPLGLTFVPAVLAASFLVHPATGFVVAILAATAYGLRISTATTLTSAALGYHIVFVTAGFGVIALYAFFMATNLLSALSQSYRQAGELQAINVDLDKRVIWRTQDLADALSREHAEASRREAILASIYDGVIVFSANGTAELANPAIGDMLGLSLPQIEEQPAENVLGGCQPADREAILDIIRGKGPNRATLKIEWTSASSAGSGPMGMSKTLSVSLANVVETAGANAGTVAVFRDITREAELDRMKSDFVSMVSHELRTPMTAIKGYVDLISAGTAGAVTETQSHFLDIIRSNVARLANLVGDTLDLSRIEAGKIQLKLMPVSLVALARQVAETLQQEFVRRSLKLELELPGDLPMVYGDPDRLVQILTNLLSNAYKYTPQGTVTVRAHLAGDAVQVDVRDTGLGISPEHQARLFTRFYRVRTPETDSIAGTGLGLSIVKSLVELHGGKIWVESQEDEGSTFSFTVPCVPEHVLEAVQAQAPVEVGRPAPARVLPPPLVMVVDDDINAARMARHYLEEAGYAVTLVTRAEEVVGAASRKRPALILLDVFLPGKDGLKVLQALRAEETTREIPVVIASVLDQAPGELTQGAAEYLSKPLDEHELISVVNRLLGHGDVARSLLVVDDEPTLTEWMRVALGRYGYEVREARNGVRALEQYQAQRPDLIVLDLQMPEMDGREFLRQLRASTHGPQVPVVVVTGNRSLTQAERDELAALGTRAVLSKPLNVESLVTEIEGYLAHPAR